MITALAPDQYDRVLPLCRQYAGRDPIIEGVLAGHNRGKVYVDDLHRPGAALIWAQHEIYFLVGLDPSQVLIRSLPDLLNGEIRPEALAMGDDAFQVELYPAAQWAPRVAAALERFHVKPYGRVAYTFDPAAYARLPDWRSRVPAGVQIRRIDAELLAHDAAGPLQEEIRNFWTSPERFLERGVGYCAWVGDRPAAYCLSVHAGRP